MYLMIKSLIKRTTFKKMHVDRVKQLVPFYSLDVIISVFYRVKSQNGVTFRKCLIIQKFLKLNKHNNSKKCLHHIHRVALIRTLATKPDILLLDEPFSALDAMTRVMLADDVYQMVKDLGKTAIMVTHDIGEAVSIADKIVVLTKRPCLVKKVYDIKYKNRTTPFNNRKEEEFNYYYENIWRDLDVKL